MFTINRTIPIIGNDSAIAMTESGHIERKVPKSLIATDVNWRTPDSAICPKNNVQEKGAAINEITKRAKNPNANLLEFRSSCSRFMAKIIRPKRPTGGSGGVRWIKSFS